MMQRVFLLLGIVGEVAQVAANYYMDCGPVDLCGVLTLETGLGPGVYHHAVPSVHGLWPETDEFGDAKCIEPQDATKPEDLYRCYDVAWAKQEDSYSFQIHEWTKHGKCAGVTNADDYFTQVCKLSDAPLKVMAEALQKEKSLEASAQALRDAGYPVWHTMSEEQVQLSACRDANNRWQLAKVEEFAEKCGIPGGAGQAEQAAAPERMLV